MPDSNLGPQAPSLGLSADEVLTTTRAVRKRLDLQRTVPREVIEECVRIAVQAPSGRNRQQWDFVFIQDTAAKAAVADVWRRGLMADHTEGNISRMSFATDEWRRIAESLDHLARHLHEVPTILIPCVRVDSRTHFDTTRGQAGIWGSVIPALWSFMLAARQRGVGTAWTTCHLSYEREMADILDIPYDTAVQTALSPVAYTVGTNFRPGPRANYHDFIHWDQW